MSAPSPRSTHHSPAQRDLPIDGARPGSLDPIEPQPTWSELSDLRRSTRIARLHLRLADVFIAAGYRVRSDLFVRGEGGQVHAVDLLAERGDGEHRSAIVVDCQSAGDVLGREHVVRIDRLRRDLGVDGAVIPSTAGLRDEAVAAARELDVDLWGPDELAVHLGRIVMTEHRSDRNPSLD